MSKPANHNSTTVAAAVAGDRPASTGTEPIRHLYVHIPFCARICPYCAFYKELLDRSQTNRFCQAIVRELPRHGKDRPASRPPGSRLDQSAGSPSSFYLHDSGERAISTEGAARLRPVRRHLRPSTIYFGGGTPTALTIEQLESVLGAFHDELDLSQLIEWTMEANPGSVSARKAGVLRKFGVNRISLGVQSWDNELLKLLGREHDARKAEQSFRILRTAGFSNINIDLMFGLPGQSVRQWQATLEKTVALQPEHISTYCLTYEEDTEFFLRQSRGEFRENPDADAELFEITMSILEAGGYEHYEISNYARPNFSSVHNRAYWSGENYLGIGPSAFSTVGMRRWQNIPDYREYAERVLSDQSPIGTTENLTPAMKGTERVALMLRTRDGVSADLVEPFRNQTREFVRLGLLRRSNGSFLLTRAGKSLADSVAEALV
jgi:oxygen-independent coproporphyrinogen-3 oxidase